MVLAGWVGRRWLLVRQVKVRAFCKLTGEKVSDPMVGCGRCHETEWPDMVVGGPPEP
jgi:hypothetical protein